MALSTVLFLALTILAAQCAVLKEAPDRSRDKRSPHDPCDDDDHWHPQHHGPPPYFTSRNWSGYSRGPQGLPQGIFSGAAATANLGPPAIGSAYSVASSSAGSGSSGSGSGGYGSQSGGYGGQQAASLTSANSNSRNAAGSGSGLSNQQFGSSLGASQGSGYGSGQSGSSNSGEFKSHGLGEQQQVQENFEGFKDHGSGNGKASSSSGGYFQQQSNSAGYGASSQPSNTAGYGQNSGQFGSYKDSHHNHGEFKNQDFDGQQQAKDSYGKSIANSANTAGELQQGQNFGHELNGKSKEVEQLQGNEQQSSDSRGQWQQGGYGSGSHASSSGAFGSNSGGYGSGSGSQGSSSGSQGSSSGGYGSNSDGYGSGSGSYGSISGSSSQSGSQESLGHGALSGALNLASQGLQTSQGLQPGCTTCSKGYALSNAKSKSGDAVAVSIGG